MKDKFILSHDEQGFLLRRYIKYVIYSELRVEGVPVTFPQTEAILDGAAVNGLNYSQAMVIINLRRAWEFITEFSDAEPNLQFMCQLHSKIGMDLIMQAGYIRKGAVKLPGVNYTPKEFIEEEEIQTGLREALKSDSITESAIQAFLYIARTQPFKDGNKRAGSLFANHILNSNARGLLAVPDNMITEFYTLLSAYYESNNWNHIKVFLYENAIIGN